MYFDLNVSSPAHIDLLIHLGYTVIALNQTIQGKYDPKKHKNTLADVPSRPGIVFLKRLTIILDADSEKGFNLTSSHSAFFAGYDILALVPTTQATLSAACLTHTLPSALTTHVISIPLTLPRLPFHLKHTLIRTALKNGAVFEIPYAGAISDSNEKRHWWASARELVRVTKGKGIIVSSGAQELGELRAPRDIANLVSLLGMPQDAAHTSLTKEPKSLVLRAQTRKTYRAVLSEPTVVIPEGWQPPQSQSQPAQPTQAQESAPGQESSQPNKKRAREENQPQQTQEGGGGEKKKKKRKKDKGGGGASSTGTS